MSVILLYCETCRHFVSRAVLSSALYHPYGTSHFRRCVLWSVREGAKLEVESLQGITVSQWARLFGIERAKGKHLIEM